MRWIVLGVIGLVGGGALWWFANTDAADNDLAAEKGFTIPAFSEAASVGADLFSANCAQCHGPHASGSENGPPLIHKIYEPGHHGDASFYRRSQTACARTIGGLVRCRRLKAWMKTM